MVGRLDHKIILYDRSLVENPPFFSPENLVTWKVEPAAENISLCIVKELYLHLPETILLSCLKLFETKDSFAEWTNSNVFTARSQ